MTLGLDTSVVVRLLTGEPPEQFELAKQRLAKAFLGRERVLVSDLVVAEAYFALRHHYGVPQDEAREALRRLVSSGLVELAPAESAAALEEATGAGVEDRLIHRRYQAEGAVSLTFDRLFARMEGAHLLER